jgi:hypothetical protein
VHTWTGVLYDDKRACRQAFRSRSVFHKKIAERFFRKKRDPIKKRKTDPEITGTILNRDPDRDFAGKIAHRFSYKNSTSS